MAEYVDKALINWAHVGIACLIRANLVDRVLTVNFDPLIIRACALLNEFPGITDFAASQNFDASHADRAVFYLHGQQSGFVQLSTREQVDEHAKQLTPVFEDAGRNRLWIVVGYSGENDPVIEKLAKLNSFANGLYWIGRPGTLPPTSVANNLLAPAKAGFFVESPGADEFFTQLAQHNKCFPPPVFATPFSHLAAVYQTLVQEFPTVAVGDAESDNTHPLVQPKAWIDKAIKRFEKAKDQTASEVSFVLRHYLAGDHEAVIKRYGRSLKRVPPEVAENVSWSFILSGNEVLEQAKKNSGEANRLFTLVGQRYAAALAIKPDKHEALNNWGIALAAQARMKTGEEADRLFALAGEKYAAALAIKPNKHEALNNWGNALSAQARMKTGEEADRLFALAGEKYAAALAIKPDKHEALNNWGIGLAAQAKTKTGEEADRLFALAGEKYAAALAVKPDKHEVLNNWGVSLFDQARMKTGEEAYRLFALAGEKYAAALAIKPDKHDTLNNWGIALAAQANTKTGEEADRLFALAGEKYAAALAIKPDNHEILNNWGIALAAQANRRAARMLTSYLFWLARSTPPHSPSSPTTTRSSNNWGNALSDQAKTKTGEEADRLFALADEKYASALAIKPDTEVLNNWGNALSDQAKTRPARRLTGCLLWLARSMPQHSRPIPTTTRSCTTGA